MKDELLKLEPKQVWRFFADLTQIPRPSKKERGAVEYVAQFAKDRGLEYIVDEVGNVIIRKPATPGMENRKGVILQGHLDMVPQKNSDKEFDFEKDPIQAYVDGEWVTADGTTLGADNGIGVAMALALLDSKDIPHPPLEALFTVDEETGMTGAFNLQPGILKGDILINLDSEQEGEIYVGCAGGLNADIKFRYERLGVSDETVAYKLSLTGLKGGHSGVDINLERGNAAKLLFRFLYNAQKEFGIQLSDFSAGNMRNAIPREGHAVVVVLKDKAKEFEKAVDEYNKIFQSEYKETDPDLVFKAEPTSLPEFVIDPLTQDNLIKAVQGTPNGVIRMSQAMEGLVETSTNLSIVSLADDKYIDVKALIRSSVDTAKQYVADMFEAIYKLANAYSIDFSGEYPGWKPNMDSEILHLMVDLYKKMYGTEPKVTAIHAGLETGLLGAKYPNWDMISIGPTIKYPHSPDEKVHIGTVQKVWEFLQEVLKNIPEK